MTMPKVQSMQSPNGNDVPNQHIIETEDGTYFQSYQSIIAFIPKGVWQKSQGGIVLDEVYWDYSRTTAKYRNQFLNETTEETKKKIDSGEYKLVNLN